MLESIRIFSMLLLLVLLAMIMLDWSYSPYPMELKGLKFASANIFFAFLVGSFLLSLSALMRIFPSDEIR